jgi:hypothetical protein
VEGLWVCPEAPLVAVSHRWVEIGRTNMSGGDIVKFMWRLLEKKKVSKRSSKEEAE